MFDTDVRTSQNASVSCGQNKFGQSEPNRLALHVFFNNSLPSVDELYS